MNRSSYERLEFTSLDIALIKSARRNGSTQKCLVGPRGTAEKIVTNW
jgi:hypothetical protein